MLRNILILGVLVMLTACPQEQQSASISGNFADGRPFAAEHVRGFTGHANLSRDDLKAVSDMGGNTVRLMLMIDDLYGQVSNPQPNFQIPQQRLERIKNFVDDAMSVGLTTILDVHEVPGYCRWSCSPKELYLWDKEAGANARALLINTWKQLAQVFSGYPDTRVIHEPLNEPEPWFTSVDGSGNSQAVPYLDREEQSVLWYELQDRLLQEIRTYDQGKIVMVQPVESWRATFPVNWAVSAAIRTDGRVWGTVHFYHPHDFTHQSSPYQTYPGMFDADIGETEWWNKGRLVRVLDPLRYFTDNFPIPFVVTEFSCEKAAPGCAQWLEDATSIFRDRKIGWTYHVFREPGDSHWDLESGSTDRLKVIQKALNN